MEQEGSAVSGCSLLCGLVWLACMLLAPMGEVEAQALDYTIAAPPAWVDRIERGEADHSRLDQIFDGAYYLLSDSQVRLDARQRTTFRRLASMATNEAGVSALANVEISFDPSFQTLELHSIDLVRKGRVIPKLETATVRVLQRETELERRIYDGSKTVSVFLEDVRVGDVVDYAYSIRGRNPVFGERDFGSFSLQFTVPVARIHARLLVPAGKELSVVSRNTALEANVTRLNDFSEYEWDSRDVPGLNVETDAPGWYDPYPLVQWSEFAEWSAVRQWAEPLYAIPDRIGPTLLAEIERIGKAEATSEDRLLAALRFVQSEIRYLGVEIGPNSHEPNPPDLVLERRFGDCKDKTLLLLTMLDRLGINAQPALVNTRIRRALAEQQPSPGQFDHVIVRAELDGQPIWLDPTRSTQNADLDHLVQADFDLALVIGPESRAPVSMEPERAPKSTRKVHVTFNARSGLQEPVEFTAVTTVEGERAESTRYLLATTSFEELQKSYLNYYAASFPGLSIVKPMQVQDDERNNRIVLTESYSIPNFSEWSESGKRHTAEIPVPDVDELLRGPGSPIRNAPLLLSHPLDVTVTTETVLPSEWTIKPSTTRVDDPAFTFERSIKSGGDRFTITDRFTSLADEVAAADTQRYVGNLGRALNETGYQLQWSGATSGTNASGMDRINWMLLLVSLMVLAIMIWLALKIYRHDPPAYGANPHSSLRGLGGWLIIPAISVTILPVASLVGLYTSLDAFAADTWSNLTTFGSDAYHALWAPVLLFELVGMLGLLVFEVMLLVMFYQRRSSFPKIYIAFLWISAAHLLIDAGLTTLIPDAEAGAGGYSSLPRTLIGSAIWTGYFLQSVRVRNTFVERLTKDRASVREVPAVPASTFSI